MGPTKRLLLILMLIEAYFALSREGVASASSVGNVYPMCFMNITVEKTEVGFIQIFAVAVNATRIRVAALTNSVDEFGTVGLTLKTTLNYTKDFDTVSFVSSDVESGVESEGIVASSAEKTFFIGVKSDVGSTAAYQALPLVWTSTEFVLAAWPIVYTFDVACSIVPALDSTCVEIYKFFPDGSAVMVASASVNQYETMRYYAGATVQPNGSRGNDEDEDMTGYYVNATKPVQVLCGHTCAQVPSTLFFCDHMMEHIPPIAQLGKSYVVPPIDGRSPNAGYVVRIVASKNTTLVRWSAPSAGSGSVTLRRGQFKEVVTSKTMEPLVVECNDSCLVMQYNKGKLAVPGDVPTDPFMMLTIPPDHFGSEVGFATPNYCSDAKLRIVFDNWVTLVTFVSFTDKLLFDGRTLSNVTSNQWDVTSAPGYATITFRIVHGYHHVSVAADGSGATFACYVYGHSIMPDSSSAYGFSANYEIIGDAVTSVWAESEIVYDQRMSNLKNESCAREEQFSGQKVLNDTYVPFPFTLSSSFSAVRLPDPCFQFYNQSLWSQLTSFTRLINYWICTGDICPYLNGEGVAINLATLQAQFDQDSQGLYVSVQVTVEVASSLYTTAVNFAKCRVEIRNFMLDFVHWPAGSSTLFPSLAPQACPQSLDFAANSFVVTTTNTCPENV